MLAMNMRSIRYQSLYRNLLSLAWLLYYIGKGKKDKISKIDIVGFLCKKGGLKSSEIGKIDVKDRFTYVAVSRYQRLKK